jgi:hypothetical protein
MIITKIKYKKGEVRVHWQVERDDIDLTTSKLVSTDQPEPEFMMALGILVEDVRKFLELPMAYADGMSICGLSLSHGEDDQLGGVVTALKDIKATAAPVVLNTPHVAQFEDEMFDHVVELIHRAERFIEGHRAQQNLFDQDDTVLEMHPSDPLQRALLRRQGMCDDHGATMEIRSGDRVATMAPRR